MKKANLVSLMVFCFLITGVSAHAADASKAPAAKPQAASAPADKADADKADGADSEKKEDAKPDQIEAITGLGQIPNPAPVDAGVLVTNIKYGRSKTNDGTRGASLTLEVDYGINIKGKTVELHCITPFTKEKSLNDDGTTNTASGFESVTCGAKAMIYDNDEKGISVSAGLDIQSPHVVGHGLEGRDPNYHMIVPISAMKTFDDGRYAIAGLITIDRTLGGGTEVSTGFGAGYRINDKTSASVGVVRSALTGNTTSDLVLSRQYSPTTVLFARVYKCNGGSPTCSGNKGVEFGIEFTRAAPSSGGKKTIEEGIAAALAPKR